MLPRNLYQAWIEPKAWLVTIIFELVRYHCVSMTLLKDSFLSSGRGPQQILILFSSTRVEQTKGKSITAEFAWRSLKRLGKYKKIATLARYDTDICRKLSAAGSTKWSDINYFYRANKSFSPPLSHTIWEMPVALGDSFFWCTTNQSHKKTKVSRNAVANISYVYRDKGEKKKEKKNSHTKLGLRSSDFSNSFFPSLYQLCPAQRRSKSSKQTELAKTNTPDCMLYLYIKRRLSSWRTMLALCEWTTKPSRPCRWNARKGSERPSLTSILQMKNK